MYSAIKDIVIAVMFWITIASTGKIGMELIYNSVRQATHERVSAGLSSTTKFTEALISDEGKAR